MSSYLQSKARSVLNISLMLLSISLLPLSLGVLFTGVASAADSTSSSVQEGVKQAAEQGADIRLLIDISGSMKKNDPTNLRIPAINLLTELIPDGDRAGVWTFGQWVNNLIQNEVVDDKWRLNAKEQAKKVNSVALYTNIGAVLEKASDDFYKKDKDFTNTHFILLTDGMVDIDRDPSKNAHERDRVLTTLLDTFKERGAKIHAVSLSKNADKSLMEKLAVQTGGQSAVAETPEDLTKIFLQALDQAVPSEQVPIEGNEFVIDSSVEEFTALIFRGDGTVPTEIAAPDESLHTYASHGEHVQWYQDKGYDLITVSRPLEGAWSIKSDVQPDSRVTVVSNLQLKVSKLPVNFFAGDQLNVEVSFLEDGKTVRSQEFLSLLDVQLQLKTEENKTATKTISDKSNPPADGVFSDAIRKLTKIGQYEVTVIVDGKTFKRKNKQVVNLRAPFDFEFAVKGEGDDAYYELVVSPLNDNISLTDSNIFVKINAPDGSSLINALELDEETGRWIIPIKAEKGDGEYKVAVKVKAETVAGKKFKFKPKPFEAVFPISPGAANEIVSLNEPEVPEEQAVEDVLSKPVEAVEPVAEPEPIEKSVEKLEPIEEVAPEPVKEAVEVDESENMDLVEDDDLAFWLIVGGGVLAGLLLLVGGVYYFVKKKKSADGVEEVLSDQDVEEINKGVETESELETPEPEPEEEPEIEIPELEDVPEISEELDFVEEPPEELVPDEPVQEEVPELVEEVVVDQVEEVPELDDVFSEDEALDLSDVVEDLELEDAPVLEETIEDEDAFAADISQAIEDAAGEQEEELPQEIEEALDISEPEEDDDDDDDEEFNLEDFDIGDTDDLPDDQK